MRKDFKNLDIYAAFQPANGAEWQKANGISADWKTPEHLNISMYRRHWYPLQLTLPKKEISLLRN